MNGLDTRTYINNTTTTDRTNGFYTVPYDTFYAPKLLTERESKANDVKTILSTYCGFDIGLIHISVGDTIVTVHASKGPYSFRRLYFMEEWDLLDPLSIAYTIVNEIDTFKISQNHKIVIGCDLSVGESHINKVIFNGPATIVFWDDGTKTVVKAENEEVDKEKGLAMAISKKFLGNKGNYYNEFKKWVDG